MRATRGGDLMVYARNQIRREKRRRAEGEETERRREMYIDIPRRKTHRKYYMQDVPERSYFQVRAGDRFRTHDVQTFDGK